MNTSTTLRSALVLLGLPALLILTELFIASTPSLFNLDPSVLSFAVTFDLAIAIPAIYLLLIWNRNVPRITAIPFFLLGLFLATVLLPEGEQRFADVLKAWVLPMVETVVIGLVIYKIRKARIEYRKLRRPNFDVLTALKEVSRQIVPGKISQVVASEIAMLYYCFVAWRKPMLGTNTFTGHKENGVIAVLSALLIGIAMETTAVHFLISQWSGVAAWIFTALSIYGALLILGITKSISRRPILLEEERLYVRNGLLGDTTIDLVDIDGIERVAKDSPLDSQKVKKLSLLSHNTLIHLKKENTIEGLYGTTKTYRTLALYVDDNKRFEESLRVAMKRNA